MDTFPTLYTNRLKLRKLEVDDIPSLVEYANNKKISDYVMNIPYPYQEPDAVFRISYVVQGFKSKARFVFAIVFKETGEFVGEIGLHMDSSNGTAQLGYWVGEPFWNKGIATEAVKKILEFGFTKLELNRIFATCHIDNPASGKVLLHNGLADKAVTGNVIQYVITKEEYGSTPR